MGSYECLCRNGYTLLGDEKTCVDINECDGSNGDCDQKCVNFPGGHTCDCNQGYKFGDDGNKCIDINECLDGTSKCSHDCVNTVGSYSCSCKPGYTLAEDGFACNDNDDCTGISCLNGGSCIDGLNSYSCKCTSGFDGYHCEQDINECSILNGGCKEVCVNTKGSYYCKCHNDVIIQGTVDTCNENETSSNIFEKHKIPRRLLPRGCSFVEIFSCGSTGQERILMSSTSSWYKLKANSSVLYTFGVVFIEANGIDIPASISGIKVVSTGENINLIVGSIEHTEVDGVETGSKRTENCFSFSITPKDVHDLIGAFLPSVFDGVYSSIPNWLKFSAKGSSVLAITDLKTDLLHGRRVNSLVECRDAPLFDQELYSIFRFGANMVLTVFGDDINLPSPLDGHKFCLIVSMCEDSKGTFHFMVPPESRHFLRKLDFVDNLYSTYGVDIKPIGLGLSLTKKINVHKSVTEIEFWNGLHFSMYLIPKTSNAWLQTNVVWQQLEESYELHLAADIEMFFTVPNLQKLLTGAFVDEWNGLVRIKQIGFTPTFKFTLFGKKVVFDFKDAVVGSIDVYFSFGGHDKRVMCGENANPEGLFLSLLINANPFRDVPYLGEWFLNLDVKFHAFLTTDSNMTSNKVIDIKTVVELIDLKSYLERFRSLTSDIVNKFGSSISLEAVGLIRDVDAATNDSIITLTSVLNTGVISPQEAVSIINNIWEQYVTLFRKKVAKILDAIEYDSSQAARNISQFLRDEQQRIEMSVETVVSSLRQNMFSAVGGYKGFGFKFSSEFTIMGLIFGPMDVELVHSIDSFSKCSKFHKVYSLLGNEESVYFLIRNTLGIRKFGSFQQLKKGQTLSFACSLKRNHFVLSYSVDLHVLRMKVEAGVVLSQGQMTIYAEGSIFNIFYARLTMTASIGRAWYDLRFSVKGELPARNGNGGFGGSYLDGLRQVANNAGQSANKRITELQKGLTVAQNVLTSAQQKLSDAQSAVRKANSVFEDAIRSLDKAKQKLEDAKKPYQKALERLAKAQKNVDRLCQIKYCAPICIGGFVWRRCSGWIGSYPCLKWSNCAYKIPNLVCHAANAACHVVRALAYAALEASKIFVRAAMIPFDIAKAAVTAVQFVVDKSRVVLLVAEGVLELARIGLETVKIGFEVAKAALESVKLILGAAFHVFNLIVKYGLQNLLDVRNCNFDLELTTVDKTEFDVSCEVKMFGLNWHTFVYEYDFKNPLLSNLRFAKSTVETLLKMIGDLFGKRRKREIAFASMTTVHHILQLQKRGISNKTIYETLKTMNSNESVDYPESSVQFKPKFSDRVSYFMFSCQLVSHINGFLLEAIEKLQSLHNESVTTLERMKNSNLTDRISNTTHDGRWAKSGNSVMELYDIDLEYAQQEFNLTEEEMLIAIESSTDASSNDTLLSSMTNESRIVEDFMKAEEENANKLSLISPWIVGMDNTTNQYFNVSDCSGFSDCVLYSFFVLYEVFSDETIDETKTAKTIISNLEDGFAELLKNQSRSVVDSSLLAQNISDFLSLFNDSNIFCSEPPTAHTKDKTLTLLAGNNVDLVCQVTGNPYPNVLWRLNGVELTGAHNQQLAIKNLQPSNAGNYTCDASNVVTKVTSESIEITVKECSPGTFFNGLDCIACNVGSFQPWKNQLECFACSKGFTTDKTASTSVDDCQDVNECSSADYYKICNHKCVNLNGTFACTCNPGFVLGDDGATCKETSMDAALLSSAVIGSIIGVFIFIFMIYKVCQKKTAKKIQPLEVQQQPIKQCFDSSMLQTQKK